MKYLQNWIDKVAERRVRQTAQFTSRRSAEVLLDCVQSASQGALAARR